MEGRRGKGKENRIPLIEEVKRFGERSIAFQLVWG